VVVQHTPAQSRACRWWIERGGIMGVCNTECYKESPASGSTFGPVHANRDVKSDEVESESAFLDDLGYEVAGAASAVATNVASIVKRKSANLFLRVRNAEEDVANLLKKLEAMKLQLSNADDTITSLANENARLREGEVLRALLGTPAATYRFPGLSSLVSRALRLRRVRRSLTSAEVNAVESIDASVFSGAKDTDEVMERLAAVVCNTLGRHYGR
jgi:hypothetical protein